MEPWPFLEVEFLGFLVLDGSRLTDISGCLFLRHHEQQIPPQILANGLPRIEVRPRWAVAPMLFAELCGLLWK